MTSETPHAVLLGGLANTTSVARSLGRKGIDVTVVARPSCPALRSKYVNDRLIKPNEANSQQFYHELFLEGTRIPQGSVIFPCEDGAIEFIANNKSRLSELYLMDIQNPSHQLDLLDKEKTLALAKQTGCSAPGSWTIRQFADVEANIANVDFPVLIKPIHSHIFQRKFGKKLFFAKDADQLVKLAREVLDAGVAFMLCEYIPGPDSNLNSYYVFINEDGERLFEFTKRVVRRAPPQFGAGSYHITEWLPDTAAMGYKFFSGIDFKGLGNIEFKTDPRDGQLKVIECNARFTAAQELVTRSGIDMPYIIYKYLTSGEKLPATGFKDFVTMLLPFEDFDSFRDLRSAGEITLAQWINSICRRHVFSYFDTDDMGPFTVTLRKDLAQRVKWLLS